MTLFSECLTRIKDKRNMSAVEMAEICNMDVSVIFSWLNGKRTPNDISKVRQMSIRMRLTKNEAMELENAYAVMIMGRKYDNYKNIRNLLITLSNKCRESEKYSFNSARNLKILYKTTSGFVSLKGRVEILGALLEIINTYENMNNLYIVSRNQPKEIDEIIRLYGRNKKIYIEQIVCKEVDKNNDTALLMDILPCIFYEKNINIFFVEMNEIGEESYLLCDQFYFQYNARLTEGLFTTYEAWIKMQREMYMQLKKQSRKICKMDTDDMNMFNTERVMNSVIRSVGFQPYVVGISNEKVLKKYSIKSFFSREGLRRFLETGILDVVCHTSNMTFTRRERCSFIRKYVPLSREMKNEQFMIREEQGLSLLGVHMQMVSENKKKSVRIDTLLENGKIEHLVITDRNMIDGIEEFYQCLEENMITYSKEETEQYMLDLVEEYENKWQVKGDK